MVKVNLKGIHRIRKRLVDGTRVEYHYAYRGGPCIWRTGYDYAIGSIEYIEGYQAAQRVERDDKHTFAHVIDDFLNSREFKRLAPRTQKDHKTNVMRKNGIAAKFGSAPISVFNSPKIRLAVQKWRRSFSEGTGDNLFNTLQRIVSFALDQGYIETHHLLRVKRREKKSRADIIWTKQEIDLMIEKAPRYISNLLVMATETGLRPGDLRKLSWAHVQEIGKGNRRIFLKTNKSRGRNSASIPVTPRLWELLKTFPKDGPCFALTADGKPFRQANSLGAAVHDWRDKLGIRKELHFYDARGTAVTRLVRAGCSLGQLAGHMGWSVNHAAAMVDHYARIDPEMSEGILERLAALMASEGA